MSIVKYIVCDFCGFKKNLDLHNKWESKLAEEDWCEYGILDFCCPKCLWDYLEKRRNMINELKEE